MGAVVADFKKVDNQGSRGSCVSDVVPVAMSSFIDMLDGSAQESSRCASALAANSPAVMTHIRESEKDRKTYGREFCKRDMLPTCVFDFPYEDLGPNGLDLFREGPDNRLLERLYCFEDYQDDTHECVGGKRRRVLLKVHTLNKWCDRGEKLYLRATKVTAVKVIYAY